MSTTSRPKTDKHPSLKQSPRNGWDSSSTEVIILQARGRACPKHGCFALEFFQQEQMGCPCKLLITVGADAQQGINTSHEVSGG